MDDNLHQGKAFRLDSPRTSAEFEAYFSLRWQLLRAPWGEPRGSETDDTEDSCFHLMAMIDDDIIAVARLQYNDAETAQIRYMAVAPAHRRRGIGREIIKRLESEAASNGIRDIVLDAREQAVPFYATLGYSVLVSSYILFGEIQHYRMHKQIA